MLHRLRRRTCHRLIAILSCSVAMPALAQEAPPAAAPSAAADQDIVITARRREETLTNAPVAVSAVGSAELERRAIVRLDNLSSAVPQLIISDAGASTQGGIVLIRGITIRQIYGQTEAGGNATMMPEHLALAEPEKCGWGSVFMDLRVVRPDGTDCAPDETGEILMRSPGMMRGYWNNPAETAKTLRDGWLHSGDLGRLDARGLLTFVDRMKDIIISGGLNISAAEVEQVVLEYAGIVEAVAIAAPDGKFGETVMVVYHAPAPIDEAELIDHCDRHLSNFKVPRYLVRSPEPLPRLISGKLSKPAIRQLYADAHERLERVR